MGIRRLLLTVTTALITLAVPSAVLAQGAGAATSGRSAPAVGMQNTGLVRVHVSDTVKVPHLQAAPDGEGSRSISASTEGVGTFHGELEWTNTYLKLTGTATGQKGDWNVQAEIYLSWHSGGVNYNKLAGTSTASGGSKAVNYFIYTSEPSYAEVTVCGNIFGNNGWTCGDPA